MAIAEYEIAHNITLKLTVQEVQLLLEVANNIGGDPKKSARGIMDGIREALEKIDIEPSSNPKRYPHTQIYFEDN